MTERTRELVDELNKWRRQEGLDPVAFSQTMADESASCSRGNIQRIERGNGGLEHCGYEVLFMGGAGTSTEDVLRLWWNSPGHFAALTHGTSTEAGGAFVRNPDTGTAVAAITINY